MKREVRVFGVEQEAAKPVMLKLVQRNGYVALALVNEDGDTLMSPNVMTFRADKTGKLYARKCGGVNSDACEVDSDLEIVVR